MKVRATAEDVHRARLWITPWMRRGYVEFNDAQDREWKIIEGFLGEILVERLLGLPVAEREPHGDGGVDIRTPTGFTIQVKTCWTTAPLYSRPDKLEQMLSCDVSVLVVNAEGGDKLDFVIAGWTTPEQFRAKMRLRTLRGGGNKVWTMTQAELWPPRTLRGYCQLEELPPWAS